ncbi:hypothetical protein V3330_17440 [Wenzhouxiangellaceae bacterium CH-27]|uniref:DUF8051 domain-containing protein n=1 Tax=Elongatibacter sediminis TaxID=3119006 RepID=A0AAW9R8Z3_9GAMM
MDPGVTPARPTAKPGPAVAVMLIVSGLMLATLAPGGPVETRDFSHIQPVILGLFNAYLTVLGLGSLLLGFLALRRPLHPSLPVLAGLSYLAVYGLDLTRVFPVSPTPMNQALWSIEVAGLILAVPLCICGFLLGRRAARGGADRSLPVSAWVIFALVGLAIVVFTTLEAMGR